MKPFFVFVITLIFAGSAVATGLKTEQPQSKRAPTSCEALATNIASLSKALANAKKNPLTKETEAKIRNTVDVAYHSYYGKNKCDERTLRDAFKGTAIKVRTKKDVLAKPEPKLDEKLFNPSADAPAKKNQ